MRTIASCLLFVALLSLIACESTPAEEKPAFTKTVNLLEYGIPVELNAPEDAKVVDASDDMIQDLRIEGDHYYVQIYGTVATRPSCKTLADEALIDYKTKNATFQRVVKQDECGFVYAVKTENDTTTYYNFDYFAVKGNKEYRFMSTTSPLVKLNQAQVEAIYEAVKNQQ